MAALGAAAADLADVEAVVRRAGTSFYRGMKILPPDRRAAMYAVYAFCRIVDDIADEEGAFAEKVRLLDGWRGRVAALYRGEAADAVTRVLLLAVRAFGLRLVDFEAVIDGMQTDAQTPVVAPEWAALDLYCDLVASAVGRLSVRAFGDGSGDADVVAHHLGRALQLTNILRDVVEDAGRGRLYLPREALERERVPLDPAAALGHPGTARACAAVAAVAQGHFRDAWAAMGRCDPRAMRPARVMGATYAAVLDALEARGWERLPEAVSVATWRKIWIALRYGLFG